MNKENYNKEGFTQVDTEPLKKQMLEVLTLIEQAETETKRNDFIGLLLLYKQSLNDLERVNAMAKSREEYYESLK
jgi:hypothetical protein